LVHTAWELRSTVVAGRGRFEAFLGR
jgi:hypothetical protein